MSKIQEIIKILNENYKDAKIELYYETPFQLLIAVLMSAQTTDKQVNKVNQEFFKVLKEPKDVNTIWLKNITSYINSIWFYRNKAKFIFETWNILLEKYNSQIPQTLEELTTLPWVWIKTAKVVLSTLYNKPYLAVDTHVHRVLNRLQIVSTKTPEATDKEASKIIKDIYKKKLHHTLILFGRYECKALKPECGNCKLKKYCNYAAKVVQ